MIGLSFLRCTAALAPTCRAMQRPKLRCIVRAAAARCAQKGFEICFISPTESSTGALASMLAQTARTGDCLCLYGDVGAGKSVFRWFLRLQNQLHDTPCSSLLTCACTMQPCLHSQRGG
jgi:hypothetical protein